MYRITNQAHHNRRPYNILGNIPFALSEGMFFSKNGFFWWVDRKFEQYIMRGRGWMKSLICFLISIVSICSTNVMSVGDDTEFFSAMDHTPGCQQSKGNQRADESHRVFSA